MKSLVVFYSLTEHTAVVAGQIAALSGARLERLEEKKPRKKGISFGAVAGALFSWKSRLKPLKFPPEEFDVIFLGGPVWAGRSVPAVNALIARTDFKGKRVFLFLTMADEKKPQAVFDSLTRRVKQRGGEVAGTLHLQTDMKEPLAPETALGAVKTWLSKAGILSPAEGGAR